MSISEDFPKGHWIHGAVAKEKARMAAKKTAKGSKAAVANSSISAKGDPKITSPYAAAKAGDAQPAGMPTGGSAQIGKAGAPSSDFGC
jgi:hypothetical protein